MEFEALFNLHKPNYATMDELFSGRVRGVSMIRVFFDTDAFTANSIFNPLSAETLKNLMQNKLLYATSEIVNIAGHFRHYFWSRHGIPTDVVFGHSTHIPEEFPEGYMEDHYKKRLGVLPEFRALGNYYKTCMNLAHKIGEFVPNVHIVDTKTMDPHTLPQVVMDLFPTEDRVINLVVSNKAIMNTHALRGSDTIVMSYKGQRSKIYTEENLGEDGIPSVLVPILTAITGDPQVGVKPVRKGIGPAKATKVLKDMLDKGEINSSSFGIQTFLDKVAFFNAEEKERLLERFQLLSVFKPATQAQIANVQSQIINKYDWEGLRNFNVRYFGGYPINLEFIVDGEEYED